jgi:hypothetical protein
MLYIFSLLHSAHPSSYAMGTGGFFPRGVKQSGRETDHSPQYNAEVKNVEAMSPLPDNSSRRLYFYMQHVSIGLVTIYRNYREGHLE